MSEAKPHPAPEPENKASPLLHQFYLYTNAAFTQSLTPTGLSGRVCLGRRIGLFQRVGSLRRGVCSDGARRCRGRGVVFQPLHAFGAALARKTAPDGLDGVGAPVGSVAAEAATRWEMHHGRAARASFTPHADALELAQLGEPVDGDDGGDGEAGDGDAAETEVGFFDEVLQVHAVQRREEGPCCEGECADAELEVEKHEGVAVGIEDGFHSVLFTVSMCEE